MPAKKQRPTLLKPASAAADIVAMAGAAVTTPATVPATDHGRARATQATASHTAATQATAVLSRFTTALVLISRFASPCTRLSADLSVSTGAATNRRLSEAACKRTGPVDPSFASEKSDSPETTFHLKKRTLPSVTPDNFQPRTAD